MKNLLKQKGMLKQYFCKHEEMYWYEKKDVFEGRKGKKEYLACKNCGKVNSIYFYEE